MGCHLRKDDLKAPQQQREERRIEIKSLKKYYDEMERWRERHGDTQMWTYRILLFLFFFFLLLLFYSVPSCFMRNAKEKLRLCCRMSPFQKWVFRSLAHRGSYTYPKKLFNDYGFLNDSQAVVEGGLFGNIRGVHTHTHTHIECMDIFKKWRRRRKKNVARDGQKETRPSSYSLVFSLVPVST